MRNYFRFGLIDSRDYGVYISGSGAYNAPRRSYTEVVVPGRNGTLLIDNGNYENIEVTYPAFITGGSDFAERLATFRSALLSQIGYKNLYDSYNNTPSQFRQGCFMNEIHVNPSAFLTAGKFDIVFNCKPQRFLDSGNNVLTLTASGTLTNPTPYPCKPLITVTGYGGLFVSGNSGIQMVIENIYPEIVIDCETKNAYTPDYYNANDALIVPTNGQFPVMNSGNVYFSFDSTITKVEVVPRWFIL